MSAALQNNQNSTTDLGSLTKGADTESASVEQKQLLSELSSQALKLIKIVSSFSPTSVIKELHASFEGLKNEMKNSYRTARPGSDEQILIAKDITNAKDLFVNDEVLEEGRKSVSFYQDVLRERKEIIDEQRNKIEAIVPNAIKEEIERRETLIKQQQESDPFDPSVDSMFLATSIADLNQRIKDLEEGNYDEALKNSIKEEEDNLKYLLKLYAGEQRALDTAQKTLNGLLAERDPDSLSQETNGKVLTSVANTKGPRLVNLWESGAVDTETAASGLGNLNSALSSAVQGRKIELITNLENNFEHGDILGASKLLAKAIYLIRRVGDSVAQMGSLELPAIIAPQFLPSIGKAVNDSPITAANAVERIATIAQADPIAAEEVLHEISKQNMALLIDSISEVSDGERASKLTEMLKAAIDQKPESSKAKAENLKEQMRLIESQFDAVEKQSIEIRDEKEKIEKALTCVVKDEIDTYLQLSQELLLDRESFLKSLDENDLDETAILQIQRLNEDIQFCDSYINELKEGKHDAALSADLYEKLEIADDMLSAQIDSAQEIAEKYNRLEASLTALESASLESLKVDVIAKARSLFERMENQIQDGGPDGISSIVGIAKEDLNKCYNQLLNNAAEALTAGQLSSAQRIIKSALKLQERFPEAVGEQIVEVQPLPQLNEDSKVEEKPVVEEDVDQTPTDGLERVEEPQVIAAVEEEPVQPISEVLFETEELQEEVPQAEVVTAVEEPIIERKSLFRRLVDQAKARLNKAPVSEGLESPEKM